MDIKNWIMIPMIKLMGSCEDITGLIEKSLDRRTKFLERIKIKLHLMGCEYCRRYEKQAVFVKKALYQFNEYSQKNIKMNLSPNIKKNIIDSLQKELNQKK